MVRYLLTGAAVLALTSSFALAQTDMTGTKSTTVISRTAPDGIGHKKVVVKRHVNAMGNFVTKKKIYREGLSGSSVTKTRTTNDPYAGTITKQRTTVVR